MSELAIGNYRTFPYYAVIGTPTGFYVWIQLHRNQGWNWYKAGEQGACDWVVGADAFQKYNKLKELLGKGDKKAFIGMMVDIHRKYKGVT